MVVHEVGAGSTGRAHADWRAAAGLAAMGGRLGKGEPRRVGSCVLTYDIARLWYVCRTRVALVACACVIVPRLRCPRFRY